MKNTSKLEHFPISFFSVIMGLAGFTLVVQKGLAMLGLHTAISQYILYIVVILFVIITALYIIKMIYFFQAVQDELNNPVRLSFFPTFTISILLLSICFLDVNMIISRYLWIVGAILHLIATIVILSMWVRQSKFEINHFNPAWFIPIVGNILVPIAGIQHFSPEISWFYYSIGIVFWILLFTIFLYRIIFHHPLSKRLMPTFFILIAPPSLGFISYVKLTGEIDSFARILYYFALFLFIFLVAQIRMFYGTTFYLSWWAYSFPIAALTVATSLFLSQTGIAFFKPLFFGFASLLTLFIIVLIVNTVIAIYRGNICVKEE